VPTSTSEKSPAGNTASLSEIASKLRSSQSASSQEEKNVVAPTSIEGGGEGDNDEYYDDYDDYDAEDDLASEAENSAGGWYSQNALATTDSLTLNSSIRSA